MSLPEKLDNMIRAGANKAVRAYNWTTGGTKKDLADNILNAGIVADSTGSFINGSFSSLIYAPFSFHFTNLIRKTQEYQHNLEQKAKEKEALNSVVENSIKPSNYMAAGMYLTGAVLFASLSYFLKKEDSLNYFDVGLSIGYGLRATSFIVMNADDLPPRKNCFKRGLEKLDTYIAAARAKPAMVAVPTNREYELEMGESK